MRCEDRLKEAKRLLTCGWELLAEGKAELLSQLEEAARIALAEEPGFQAPPPLLSPGGSLVRTPPRGTRHLQAQARSSGEAG